MRFVKLLGKDVNIGEWALSILKKCNFGPLVRVTIGLSYTAIKRKKLEEECTYMFAPRGGGFFDEKFVSREEAYEAVEKLKVYDSSNLMDLIWLKTSFGENFRESGWIGKTPIALHLWIQK